jgi:tripartite-type tricarboxylate transporter receptor subunit TctC
MRIITFVSLNVHSSFIVRVAWHALIGAAIILLPGQGAAYSQPAEIYPHKQIRMIIPAGVGGGYDSYARILVKHLEKFIPGNPVFVNQNMPGASGMVGTNWTASVAPKDGSVISITYNTLLLEPLFGNAAAKYDPRELEWIGSMGKQQQTCATWHTSPIKTIEKAREREVVVAATGATGNSALMPKQLNALLGTKFRVISGYSTSESRLAVERGEVEGICGLSLSTLKASSPEWIQNKRINILIQTGAEPQEGLSHVPLLSSLVKDADDRQALTVLAFPEETGRPFFMPPGTPKQLVQVMRRAFDATLKDAVFLIDAEKARLELDPVPGEQIEAMIRQVYTMPEPLIRRAQDLSK